MHFLSSSAVALCLLGSQVEVAASPIHAKPSRNAPRVDLGYAIYEGTATSIGINQFLGMRYAAPANSTRFRLPAESLPEKGIVRAQKHGPICLGVINPTTPGPPLSSSEDCLFIDVYAPANVNASNHKGLPVMLWIEGGGYTLDYTPNYNGSGLIQAADNDLIVVTFNYRVGPFGFLANKELESEGNLNVGLHDQLAAMRWVQQYISAFGGDPDQVTLFGASVGGGSVLLHLFDYGGDSSSNQTVPWKAGIAESMYLPSVYTVKEMDFHTKYLLSATNCSDIDCLRKLPIDHLQAANVAIPFPGQSQNALFGYGPVIDGSLLPDRPSNLLKQGKFSKDKPLIMGSSNTEGTIFTPQANTTRQVNQFLKAQYPGLTKSTLGHLESLYKDTPSTYPGVQVSESPLYYRAAEMFGDAGLLCPAFNFAAAFVDAGVPVHMYLDRIHDAAEVEAGFIVPHTWDIEAVWGPSYAHNYVSLPNATSYEPGQSNAAIVPVVQAYWTSFGRSGDPNTFKSKNAPTWQKLTRGNFLNIETNNTFMEHQSKDLFRKCNFWATVYDETRQ